MTGITEEKKALRARYKDIRAGLDTKKLSLKICENCLSLPFLSKADTVLLYASKGSEADITSLLPVLTKMGKTVGFPRCIDSENMVFHKVSDISELTKGYFGLREPDPTLPLIRKEDTEKDTLCRVPALAFDRRGYRLGYGKGYYDRFLRDFSGKTAGITFEKCLADNIPTDVHDMKTDYIITESQVTKAIED